MHIAFLNCLSIRFKAFHVYLQIPFPTDSDEV